MTSGISKRFTINYDFTGRKGVTSSKTITMCADTADQAREEFDADTKEMAKHRSVTRRITSIEFRQDNPTFSAAEDFAARYGVSPVQYEEE